PLPARAAFVVAEQIRAGAAQAALAQAGARAAATDPATAQLARQVQTLREQRQAVRTRLTAEYGKLAAQRDAERLMHLQQEEPDTAPPPPAHGEPFRTAFPAYATRTTPEPLELPALAQLLPPDEGLVSFFTLDDRLLLWLARRDQAPVYREVSITRTALQ